MDFYQHYETNLTRVLTYRDLVSGTHAINLDAASEWIASQANPHRRAAARTLIDNTHYITFNQVFEGVRDLIEEIYRVVDVNNVCLYVAVPTQSFYFMAVIAVYYIRLLGYPDPTIVDVEAAARGNFEDTLVIIDDMSYTGSQLNNIITGFHTIRPTVNLHVGLIGITEAAQELLRSHRFSLYTRTLYPRLSTVLGDKEFLAVCYYFSPYTGGSTQVSIYFDHKIADELSTFLKTLMYGPVLPCNLEYPPERLDDLYTTISSLTEIGAENTDALFVQMQVHSEDESIKARFFNALNQMMGRFGRSTELTAMLEQIIQDDMECDRHGFHLEFIPFIAGCSPPQGLGDLSYYSFISGDVNEGSAVYRHIMIQLIDPTQRCIHSFYKQGPYAMI